GAIICHGLVILAGLFLIFMLISLERRINLFRELGMLVIAVTLLVVGLVFTWQILFILFLRAVARAFDNERLAQGLNGFLTFHCIVTGGSFFFLFLVGLLESIHGKRMAEDLRALVGCGGVLLFVGAIVDLVWFLSVLVRTRDNIGARY